MLFRVLLLRLLVAVVVLLAMPAPGHAEAVLDRAEAALVRAPLRGDEAFLIGQARQMRGLKPLFLRPSGEFVQRKGEFPYSLEFGLWDQRDRPVVLRSPLFALPAVGLSQPARARALRDAGAGYLPLYVTQSREVVRVMQTALECRPGSRPPAFGVAGYEYLATHQVAAVLLAWRRGCMTGGDFRKVAPPYIARVKAEYEVTRHLGLNDLQVERMAMLCLTGFCAAVAPGDLERLRKAQSPDGFWRFRDNIREMDEYPPHASALAYFVLASSQAGRQR